jgi:competence protein ComEA
VAEKIDINRASVDELATIPGVGRVCAERIIAFRDSRGGIRDMSELDELGLRRNVITPLKHYSQV